MTPPPFRFALQALVRWRAYPSCLFQIGEQRAHVTASAAYHDYGLRNGRQPTDIRVSTQSGTVCRRSRTLKS
jgi:hypothetical protein